MLDEGGVQLSAHKLSREEVKELLGDPAYVPGQVDLSHLTKEDWEWMWDSTVTGLGSVLRMEVEEHPKSERLVLGLPKNEPGPAVGVAWALGAIALGIAFVIWLT